MFAGKNLYTYVHSSITENSQKVQTTQNVHQLMNDTKWINNHTMDDYSSMKRNRVLIEALTYYTQRSTIDHM